jgi:hypothetical protein
MRPRVTAAHARMRLEAVTEQARELAAAAQKLGADTARPIKTGIGVQQDCLSSRGPAD